MTLLLLFAGLLLLSVPIAAVLSVLTVVPSFFRTFPVGVSYAVRSMVGGSDSFLLLAIPTVSYTHLTLPTTPYV